MKIITNDNITYRLGRNAIENFELIDNAAQDDWWFHLDGHPSGHVIIDSDIIDTTMKMFAGQLVKDYSKMKNIKNVKIVFTQVKNIVKTKIIGTVILKQSDFFFI
jgi:predicted ribosome quality control (RQC) complex YloA/Tae2 family protein